jgi:hypothetical protein
MIKQEVTMFGGVHQDLSQAYLMTISHISIANGFEKKKSKEACKYEKITYDGR